MRKLDLAKYLLFLSKKYTKFTSLIFRTPPGSWEKDVLLCVNDPDDPYKGMIPPFGGKGKPPKAMRNRTPPKR